MPDWSEPADSGVVRSIGDLDRDRVVMPDEPDGTFKLRAGVRLRALADVVVFCEFWGVGGWIVTSGGARLLTAWSLEEDEEGAAAG